MSDIVQYEGELQPLERPLLITAFRDLQGETAAGLAGYLVDQWEGELLAEIDPDPFYDFTRVRPVAKYRDGQREIEWPAMRLHRTRPAGSDRDVLILSGPEPTLRWKSLIAAIADVLETAGVEETLGVSTFEGATPHTRDVPVWMSASDAEFAAPFGVNVVEPRYQGPIGFNGALSTELRSRGLRTAHLIAVTPFYLGSDPNPPAALELLHALDRGLGTQTPVELIRREADQFVANVTEMLNHAPQIREVVGRLETQYDANRLQGGGPPAPSREDAPELPTGGEVVADVEDFLRQSRGPSDAG